MLVLMKQGDCIRPLSRSVHCNFVREVIGWKGEGVQPPPSSARADFSIMMGCTPESAIATLCVYSEEVTVNSKEENSQDFCPNYVQEFGLWQKFCSLLPLITQKVFMNPDTCETDLENLYRLQGREKLYFCLQTIQPVLLGARCSQDSSWLWGKTFTPYPQGGRGEIMDEWTIKTPNP